MTISLDVFLLMCDECFAKGAIRFSKEAASIEWDRLVSRGAGTDLLEVARDLTTAFTKKNNDPNITEITLWDHPAMAHEVTERFKKIILHDLEDPQRGVETTGTSCSSSTNVAPSSPLASKSPASSPV